MSLGSKDDDRGMGRNHDQAMGEHSKVWNQSVDFSAEANRLRGLSIQNESKFNLSQQIDHPGPPKGASLHSVSAADAADSFSMLNKEARRGGERREELGQLSKAKREGNANSDEIEDFGEDIVKSLLLEDETGEKDANDGKKDSKTSREKVRFSFCVSL